MAHVLIKNFSANVFGQIVHAATIFLLVPIYLTAWGVEVYGTWLVLLAVPAMFASTADAGLLPVAGNEMTNRFAQGKREDVVRLFQSSWIFVTGLSLLVMGAAGGVAAATGVNRLLGLSGTPENETLRVLACLLAVGLVNFQNGMAGATLRAIGRMAEGILVTNLAVLAESIAIAGALLLGAPMIAIALLMLAGRVCALAANIGLLHRFAPYLRYGIRWARGEEVWDLLVPSVAFLAFPIGYAATLQGIVLVLGHVLGPVSVALFSTTRTVSNLLVQAISVFSWASWPEISRQRGAERYDIIGAYLTHGTQVAFLLAFAFAVVVIAGAPVIFAVWTAGHIQPGRLLVTALVVAAIATTHRAFPDTIIKATNSHVRYSAWFLLVSLATLAACHPAAIAFDVIGATLVLVTGNVTLLLVSMTFALWIIGDGVRPLLRVVTSRPPIDRLLSRS
jgi:O-antigen/teichoic acid export membrane protein